MNRGNHDELGPRRLGTRRLGTRRNVHTQSGRPFARRQLYQYYGPRQSRFQANLPGKSLPLRMLVRIAVVVRLVQVDVKLWPLGK